MVLKAECGLWLIWQSAAYIQHIQLWRITVNMQQYINYIVCSAARDIALNVCTFVASVTSQELRGLVVGSKREYWVGIKPRKIFLGRHFPNSLLLSIHPTVAILQWLSTWCWLLCARWNCSCTRPRASGRCFSHRHITSHLQVQK